MKESGRRGIKKGVAQGAHVLNTNNHPEPNEEWFKRMMRKKFSNPIIYRTFALVNNNKYGNRFMHKQHKDKAFAES